MSLRPLVCLTAGTLCACSTGSNSGSVPQPASVTNLGLVTTQVEGGASMWATSVREDLQEADLNADGDRDDELVYVYDSAMKELHATNLEGGTDAVVANERFLAFLAREGDLDLNGDGDAQDAVLHVFDPVLEQSVNLGVAVIDPGPVREALAIEGELLAARVSEASQSEDLNGDGDQQDLVVEVFRPLTGERWNTSLAASEADLEIHSGLVVLSIDEAAQGADFDGNGYQQDFITAFYDPNGGVLHNTRLVRIFGVLPSGGPFGLSVGETSDDLNGDGDRWDAVPFTYDPLTEEALPAPFYGGLFDAGEGRFALGVSESATDLNADGDLEDSVAFLYEPRTHTLHATGLALAPDPYTWARIVQGNLVLFASEAAQRADLNGDRDLLDSVLHVVDRDGVVRNTRVAGQGYEVHGGTVLFSRDEVADRRDWNGDGDRVDSVLFAFDPATSRLTSLEMNDFQLQQIRGERALITLGESLDAHADLNGDGELDDIVFAIQDLATGRRFNTRIGLGVPLVARATADGSFLISAWELQDGRDLNGDGDLDDYLLHVAE